MLQKKHLMCKSGHDSSMLSTPQNAIPSLPFQKQTLIKEIKGSGGHRQYFSYLISICSDKMKKKIQKLSITLFNPAGNLCDEHWKLSNSWTEPFGDFPTEPNGLFKERQRALGQMSPSLPYKSYITLKSLIIIYQCKKLPKHN